MKAVKAGEGSKATLLLQAIGAGAVLFVCCVIVPVLLGAGLALSFASLADAAILIAAILVGSLLLRRHRARRCRC